jgi:hypothetical protein
MLQGVVTSVGFAFRPIGAVGCGLLIGRHGAGLDWRIAGGGGAEGRWAK